MNKTGDISFLRSAVAAQAALLKKKDARRKRVIEAHPYCALCGTTKQLTTHHVGGMKHLTVLCEPCHSNYERQRQKRLIMRGIKNGQ